MPCRLFEPTLKTWLLKRTFLIKLTNINTYLSMQFKFTYLTDCLKGTSRFLFYFLVFYFCLICFVLVMQSLVYILKSNLKENKINKTNCYYSVSTSLGLTFEIHLFRTLAERRRINSFLKC